MNQVIKSKSQTFDQFYTWAKALKSSPLGKIVRSTGCSCSSAIMSATFITKNNKTIYYHSELGWETEEEFKKRGWKNSWDNLKDTQREFILLMFPEVHQWDWSKQDLKSPDKLVITCLNKAIREKLIEKLVCSRCGGTGHYSYNMMHGTMCYGCGGSKYQYPRITKKLIKQIKEKRRDE